MFSHKEQQRQETVCLTADQHRHAALTLALKRARALAKRSLRKSVVPPVSTVLCGQK